jgi:ribonuclease P protein component
MPGLGRARRVRAAREFAAVRATGRTAHATALMLAWCPATEATAPTRYGFVVGKRVGNAVIRNLVKRRLRAIMAEMQADIAPGLLVVITARQAAATRSFDDLRGDIRYLLRRAKLRGPAPAAPTAADPQEGSR